MYMQCQTCLSWVMGMNIMRRRELQLSMWSMPGPTGDAGAWISAQNEPPVCRDKIRQNWILILLLPCCYWNIWYQFKCFILFPRFSRAACAVAAWACSARFKTGAVVSWSQKIWRQQKSINSQQLHGQSASRPPYWTPSSSRLPGLDPWYLGFFPWDLWMQITWCPMRCREFFSRPSLPAKGRVARSYGICWPKDPLARSKNMKKHWNTPTHCWL